MREKKVGREEEIKKEIGERGGGGRARDRKTDRQRQRVGERKGERERERGGGGLDETHPVKRSFNVARSFYVD